MSKTTKKLNSELKLFCRSLGFDLFGIISPGPSRTFRFYQNWLQAGYHADMDYLVRHCSQKSDPHQLLPEAKSIICLGASYFSPDTEATDPDQLVFARYARGRDYHLVIPKLLKKITVWLDQKTDTEHQYRCVCDTAPLLEKEWASRAGLGFIGNNTLLINPQYGSYFVLGFILTDMVLTETKTKISTDCGTCRRCLDACPTKALCHSKNLDAGLCLSYHTIENRGHIPIKIRQQIGQNIFGCDICQQVCPFNRSPKTTTITDFMPKPFINNLSRQDIIKMDIETYRQTFSGMAIKRAKLDGLKRNVGP